MSARSIYEPEPQLPTQTCIDIITAGNKSQSTSFVTSILKSRRVLGRWAMGHVNRFTVLGPLWVESDEPFGLTMLGINCTGRPDTDNHKQFQMAIRDNMQVQMETNNVELLTKKDYFLPQTAHEIRVIFSTFEAILSEICSPEAILSRMMQGWIEHFDQNFTAYNSLQQQQSPFGAKLLYQIDLSIQLYLEQLSNPNTDLHDINTYNIDEEMTHYQHQVQRRNQFLQTRLPSCVFDDNHNKNNGNSNNNKKRKNDDSNNTNATINSNRNNNNNNNTNNQNNDNSANHNNNNNSGTRSNQRRSNSNTSNTGSPAYNRNQKESWKVPYPKQFHQCFYADSKKTNTIPKFEDKEFCIRFLALGECSHGTSCRFHHKDPRECGMEAQLDAFFRTAYS
jgi:hypothetical protein